MRRFDSKRARRISGGPTRVLVAASLGIASFAIFALNASPASAGVSAHGRVVSPALRLSQRTASPGTWSSELEVPGSAALNTGNNAGVYTISCSSSGNCSAGGNYVDASGNYQAFVVNEAGGTWGTAIEVPGTAALNAGGSAVVNSVSCSSAGNCGAAGAYLDSAGNVQGFVVNELSGTWGTASQVVDPSAVGSTNAQGAESISCTGTGSCTAVGEDLVASGDSVGFALSESGGSWSDAVEITLVSTFGPGGTSLDNVSCSSAGNCTAAGNGLYPDAALAGGNAYIPFVVTETAGTWGNPSNFPGLASLNIGLNAVATALSCSSVGNCSAGGAYTDGNGKFQSFVASETKGTWDNAIEVPGTSSLNLGAGLLTSLSCASNTNCSGAGLYTDASGNAQSFVVDESAGAWGNALEVPGSTSLFSQGVDNYPVVISCGAAGDCSSGGAYYDTSGNDQAYVVVEKDGIWSNAIEVPGTGAANTGGDSDVAAISCSSDTGCGAAGWYSFGSQEYQAFTTDMTPLFGTQTPLNLRPTHGTVGVALKLSASGGSGIGALQFSVVNGSAKGCSVNGNILKATSAGTCLVTVTKLGDPSFLPRSATSFVFMSLPAKPKTLTLKFVGSSSALSSAAKSELKGLSRKLIAGASVTVTGIAKGNATLARSRADAVQSYLSKQLHLHITVRTNTASGANSATVVTTKE